MDPLVPVVHAIGPRPEPSEGADWVSETPTPVSVTLPVFLSPKV